MDEFAFLDATAQAELVRGGQLSALELVEAAIDRLDRLNPDLDAVIHLQLERARDLATNEDLANGAFCGVPFLLKDIGGDEAGQPQHSGMRCLKEADYRPKEDAHITQKFAAAGLISPASTGS